MLLDQIFFALKRIKERFLESLMVILGLGLGIGIVTAIFVTISNFNSDMQNNTEASWMRTIRLVPTSNIYSESGIKKIGYKDSPDIYFDIKELEEVKKLCSTIDYAFIQLWENLPIQEGEVYDSNKPWWEVEISGQGISNDYFPFEKLKIDRGTLFTEDDYLNSNKVIILGANISKKLFKTKDPIGEKLTFNNITYTVVGILKEYYDTKNPEEIKQIKSYKHDINNKIYMPYTSVSWYSEWNKLTELSFGIDDPNNIRRAIRELELYTQKNYREGEVSIEHNLDFQERGSAALSNLLTVVGLITVICLIIAALNNLNLMLARVLRQKKEMGISLALGSTRKQLFLSVLIETSILGLIGGVIGIAIALAFVKVLNSLGDGANFQLGAIPLLISIGLSILITFLFSIYPGIEASKTNPSMVLRQD